jgi:mannose-1-phosphate guanylyltransferase
MGLFRADRPWECGIAEMDKNFRIVSFVEKPKNPRSNLANAGVYVAGRGFIDRIPEGDFADCGSDIIPKLVGKMHGYLINEYLIDVGTLSNYRRAVVEWRDISRTGG